MSSPVVFFGHRGDPSAPWPTGREDSRIMLGDATCERYIAHMSPADRRFLSLLGSALRGAQESSGMSLAQLARESGLSRRHVTEALAGRANLSVLKLLHLSKALSIGLPELLDIPHSRPSTRVALVGLRGAGKSTIGRALGMALEAPFVELDELIEQSAGLTLSEIFDLHGEASYRRLESEALETHLASAALSVLATGGSIVTHPSNFNRLLESTHVVWLRAHPNDHWNRVVNQGDTRPMKDHPGALDDIKSILAERTSLYARAHLTIDTSIMSVDAVVSQILESVDA